MRIAVVGAGLFGATAAVELARAGAKVDLFDARNDIIGGATSRNQARLHRGYHYPRSDATAAAARDAFPQFVDRYPQAVDHDSTHHYVIAQDSKTGAADYLAFCARLGLPYEMVDPPAVHGAQLCVKVPEAFIDIAWLRRLVRRDLFAAGVELHLGQEIDPATLDHDLIVMATYGQPWLWPLRYEVCEVALLEVGLSEYRNQSFVVLDGDHVSLDPHGRAHMLYDVRHSVHAYSEGHEPLAMGWPRYRDLLGALGPVRTPLSNVSRMIETAGRHLRGLDQHGRGVSIYHGSWFAVRAVLLDVDESDRRPTLVERRGNVISILSGKMCTAVAAARKVIEAIELAGLSVTA